MAIMHNYNFALTYLLFLLYMLFLLWSYASRRYFISDTLSSGLLPFHVCFFCPRAWIKNLEQIIYANVFTSHQTF